MTQTIFAGSSVEAALVRSFLEDHGISAFLMEERVGTIAPYAAAAGGAGAVKVAVAAEDVAKAKYYLAERGQSD